jgi:hypothetical protein
MTDDVRRCGDCDNPYDACRCIEGPTDAGLIDEVVAHCAAHGSKGRPAMSADDGERWLPIPWAPDYEVSDCARVRTTRRRGNQRQTHHGGPRLVTVHGRWLHLYAYLPGQSDGKYRPRNVVRIMDAVFDAEDAQA